MPGYFSPVSHVTVAEDEAIYQYIGYLITKGRLPYLDVFDHKGIILYLLYATGYLINARHGQWIIDVVFMFFTFFLSLKMMRKYFSNFVPYVVCLIVYAEFLSFTLDRSADTPEFYAMPFIVAGLYLLSERKHPVLFGVVTGIVFWIKYTVLVTLFVIFVCFVTTLFVRQGPKPAIRHILKVAGGFAGISLPICLWFVATHSWSSMVEFYFAANLIYSADPSLYELTYVKTIMTLLTQTSFVPVWIMFLIYLLVCLARKEKTGKNDRLKIVSVLIISAVISILFFALPRRSYGHYVFTLYPLMTLISVIILSEIKTCKFTVPVVSVIALMSVAVNMLSVPEKFAKFTMPGQDTEIIGKAITENSTPGDLILIQPFGLQGLYLECERDCASRYLWADDLVTALPGFEEEYAEDITEARPNIVVLENISDINLPDCYKVIVCVDDFTVYSRN